MNDEQRQAALVLCAHGISGQCGMVAEHARALAQEGRFSQVHGCALYGDPRLEVTLDALPDDEVLLVPYLMAEGYTLKTMQRRVADHPAGGRVTISRPVGTQAAVTTLIAEKALSACHGAGWGPAETALLLVGHGTVRNPASGATTQAHARALARQGHFAQVAAAFLDQPPVIAEAVARLESAQVLAVGFFTDAGSHGQEDVPERLGETGRTWVYAGPIGTDARMTRLLGRQAALCEVV